jgi:hypothetical protein
MSSRGRGLPHGIRHRPHRRATLGGLHNEHAALAAT